MKSVVAELLDVIQRRSETTRFICGIDGLSRSGKTTWTAEIYRLLVAAGIDTLVIHIDDHITDRATRYETGAEEWYEYYGLQWDVQPLTENLFARLRGTEPLELPFYNEENDAVGRQTVILPHPPCVVLIEGVFLQRPEWRDSFDFVVFLDCPRDVRFAREKPEVQQLLSKFQRRYWKAEDYYLATIHPRDHGDLVVESS